MFTKAGSIMLLLVAVAAARAQSSTWTPNPNTSRSVFARSAGDLVLHSQTAPGGWQALNLSSPTGTRITGTPRPLAGYQFDASRNEHFWRADVFARSTTGSLIHYWWTPRTNWQNEDLTAQLGGPALEGDPVPVLGYQNRSQFGSLRHDVFGRNAANQLIHYWWTVQTGWRAENLTTMTGGPAIHDNTIDVLVSRQNGYLRHDVFARNNAQQLIHYWWSAAPPSGWHAENLTQITGGPTVTGSLEAVLSYQEGYLRHDVFSSNGAQLIHYWWSAQPPSGWRAGNITTTTNGPPVAGKIEVAVAEQNGYLRHDVFARDVFSRLVHYWWSAEPPSGWHGENLTNQFGVPIGRSPEALAATQTGYLRHDVFARGLGNDLIHYWWSEQPPSGWRPENLTTFTGGPKLSGELDVQVTGNTIMHEVFGRSDTQPGGPGHLIRYWWTASNGWQTDDLTSITTSPAISGDPVAMTFPLERAPIYIRNRSQYDINQVWLVSSNGPGLPLERRMLTPDLSALLPFGADYNNEIVAYVPLLHYPAASAPNPYYVLQHIQEELRFRGAPQYHSNPRSTSAFAPGVIHVPGYTLVRETMFIFDWSGVPTSRFEQMLRGPDGKLYLFRPGGFFHGHPEVDSGPILLQTLIDEGYSAYAPWQRVP
jgi:hypothetical protein